MIIQIRGTSGSGKTTAMLRVKDYVSEVFNDWQIIERPGRSKRPLFYYSPATRIALLGSYETSCGGCDSLGSARLAYELIQELDSYLVDPIYHILCEGLLLSEDTKWTLQLENVHCIYLVTSLDQCLKNIYKRREVNGNDRPLNEQKHVVRDRFIQNQRKKLIAGGVNCRRASADQAPKIVLNWLGAKQWIKNRAGSQLSL